MSDLQIGSRADVATQDASTQARQDAPRAPRPGVTQAMKPIGFSALPSSHENKNVETTSHRNSSNLRAVVSTFFFSCELGIAAKTHRKTPRLHSSPTSISPP